ncbi:sigma-70 family RNA polymerase sigma factor [Leucobacter sp. W1153]|uniref:sigma-70 family RNA polymerase sigma factor n=1 Tax=Leucobacter sp. W1153 TaxID=3439064 RepID=UPI003F2E626D
MVDGIDPHERSDVELVHALRCGEQAALSTLWLRHHDATVRMAARIVGRADAEDLAQEAFLAMHQAIQRGGGPTIGVRAYLYTIARNIGVRSLRRHAPMTQSVPIDALEGFLGDDPFEQHAEHAVIFEAFRALPSRWQEALWYSEVEGLSAAEVAEILGLTSNGASQLAFRAREGLRQAWIEGQIECISAQEECAWVLGRMGAYVRDRTTKADTLRIDAHLSTCDECARIASEASYVGLALGPILLVGLLGAAAVGNDRGDPVETPASSQAHSFPAQTLASAGYARWALLAGTAAATAVVLVGGLVQAAPTTVVSSPVAIEQLRFAPVPRDSTPVEPSSRNASDQPPAPDERDGVAESASMPKESDIFATMPSEAVSPPLDGVPDLPVAPAAPVVAEVDPDPPLSFPLTAPGWAPERSTVVGATPLSKYSITVTGPTDWQVRAVIDGVEVAHGVIGPHQHSLSPLAFLPEKQQQLDDVVVTFEFVSGSTTGGVPLQLRLSELGAIP